MAGIVDFVLWDWYLCSVLSSKYAVFFLSFFFFRVLKGLQDSRVRRYVCPSWGVMILRLPEPDLTPFTSQGDPGVGVQGPPGPVGPPGLKVSRCPPPQWWGRWAGGPWRWEGEGVLGLVLGRGPAGTTPPFAVSVPGRLGSAWSPGSSWYCRVPWSARPSRRSGSARPQRRTGKGAGHSVWGRSGL